MTIASYFIGGAPLFCSATRRFRDSSYPRLGFLEPRQKILPPALGQCLHLNRAVQYFQVSRAVPLCDVQARNLRDGDAIGVAAITSIRSPAPTSPSRKTEK